VPSSRAFHFDGCVLTYEPRWGDELPAVNRTEEHPEWEESTDSQSRVCFVGRIALGLAIAFLRQTISSSETKVARSSLANHSEGKNEGPQSGSRAGHREFCQR